MTRQKKKEKTPEQIKTHKSKLRVMIDHKSIDPYPFLPLTKQIGIYAEEILFSHSGFYWKNWDNENYVLYDKYQGTTSDPVNMKIVLNQLKTN